MSVYCCKHIFRYDSVRKLLDTLSYTSLINRDDYILDMVVDKVMICICSFNELCFILATSAYIAIITMGVLKLFQRCRYNSEAIRSLYRITPMQEATFHNLSGYLVLYTST